MYRDSQLGLCIDVAGPDGNVFNIWATGDMLAKQIGITEEWRAAVDAAKLMDASYATFLHLFETFFPIVTLVNKEIYFDTDEQSVHEDQEEDY